MNKHCCLSDQALRLILTSVEDGVLDEHQQAQIDNCEICQRRLERLAAEMIDPHEFRSALASPKTTSANLIATIDRLSDRKALSAKRVAPHFDDLQQWINVSEIDGSLSLDSYTLEGCVGRGGMGVVFRARMPDDGKVVALKAMLPERARDARERERFLREARAMASVRHPNVVALHTVSEIDGLPYLVMEYVDGQSLETLIQEGIQTAPEEIIRIGASVAAGLAACHERGIIHRDIKPSNILVSHADNSIKITDFGLASVSNTPTLTHAGYLSGTPDYVAPERLAIDSKPDGRSDLFSLGCVLYKLATGTEPFGGDTPLITLHRIASTKPKAASNHNNAIPTSLERAIDRLIAKRPEDRPPTAQAARELLLGGGVQARSRSKVWLTSAAIALIFITTIAVIVAKLLPAYNETTPTELVSEGSTAIVTANAEQFLDAIKSAGDGDVILIDSDSPIYLPPIEISGKLITIAAAENRAPEIVLESDNDHSTTDYFIRVKDGGLHLIDLTVRDEHSPTESPEVEQVNGEQYSLFSISNSKLTAEGCRLSTADPGTAIRTYEGSRVQLYRCELFAQYGSAIIWFAGSEDQIKLDNCVVVGVSGFVTSLKGDAELILKESMLLVHVAALELSPLAGKLTANVSGCTIQTPGTLVTMSFNPKSKNDFQDRLAWIGIDNRIRGQDINIADDEDVPDWGKQVTKWAVRDEGSMYDSQLFSLEHDEVITQVLNGRLPNELMVD